MGVVVRESEIWCQEYSTVRCEVDFKLRLKQMREGMLRLSLRRTIAGLRERRGGRVPGMRLQLLLKSTQAECRHQSTSYGRALAVRILAVLSTGYREVDWRLVAGRDQHPGI